MGFSMQEYWSGLPCPPPGDLPDPGIQPASPVTSGLQADSLPLSYRGSPCLCMSVYTYIYIYFTCIYTVNIVNIYMYTVFKNIYIWKVLEIWYKNLVTNEYDLLLIQVT